MSGHSLLIRTFLSAFLCVAHTVVAQEHVAVDPSSVTSYPASYFARSKVYSAFEMLALLPGYTFMDSDADLRGYAGAAGNVMLDGSRPASKSESLETILRRIPAGAVDRIELIRAGTPGMDMQGYAVLANVVRVHAAEMRGSLEVGHAFYERSLDAPRLGGEMTHRAGDRLIELSGSIYRLVDEAHYDQYGAGSRSRISPEGELLRTARYVQDETEKVAAAAAGYEDVVLDGTLRLHGSIQKSRVRTDVLENVEFPAAQTITGEELGKETSSELGMHFRRGVNADTELELLAIRRDMRARAAEHSVSPDESSLFRDQSTASESILRTLMRHRGSSRTLEGGMELALNTLDSHASLAANDGVVIIPSSDVRVEERRVEAFITSAWVLGAMWHVELAARFEYSALAQDGDSGSSKSFFFPKPRARLSWSRNQDQVRLSLERDVAQLEFEDFASSASLSSGIVTAGNPNLEPDRTWRAELAWDRRFRGVGAIAVAVRHEEIEDVIDLIPVTADSVFDAIGNIGAGSRDELEIQMTLPLDAIGISAGTLKASVLWRQSETTDPITREARPISEDEPFEATVHFQQALARWKGRWGIDVTLQELEREYRFDEVRVARDGATLDVFVEYEPASSWNVRLFANNLTDRESEQRRRVYDGMRSDTGLRYIDTRRLRVGPYAGILVRHRF